MALSPMARLNAHEIAQEGPDHRFVYLGPRGSFTPLHKDVLNSFSWSVNVAGRCRGGPRCLSL
jgi:hypothetical protein